MSVTLARLLLQWKLGLESIATPKEKSSAQLRYSRVRPMRIISSSRGPPPPKIKSVGLVQLWHQRQHKTDNHGAENGIFMVGTRVAQTLGGPLVPWINLGSFKGVVLVQQ